MSPSTSDAARLMAEETGVTPGFAEFWLDIFAEKARMNPRMPGEEEASWLTDLVREVHAEVQALGIHFLSDAGAKAALVGELSIVAKAEFGHHHTRKPWGEVSPSAKEILEMKQARKGDTE